MFSCNIEVQKEKRKRLDDVPRIDDNAAEISKINILKNFKSVCYIDILEDTFGVRM